MRIEQGYVHIPLNAGTMDGIIIEPDEHAQCARCGRTGGDVVSFRTACDWMHVHVACMEALTYTYRTGRKPRAPRKGE